MSQPFKEAFGLCKTIMRNGFDAFVINARLQQLTFDDTAEIQDIDICTEMGLDELRRCFPKLVASDDRHVLGVLQEGAVRFNFYPADVDDASHPEECVAHLTPRLLKALD